MTFVLAIIITIIISLETFVLAIIIPIIISLETGTCTQSVGPKRWITEKGDWDNFRNLTEVKQDYKDTAINTMVAEFNEVVLKAALECVPQTQSKTVRKPVPWWCEEIKLAIKAGKKALRVYRKTNTLDNFINLKKCRAVARNLIREKSKAPWLKFITSINSNTPTELIWKSIKTLSRKQTFSQIKHIISSTENILESPIDIANQFSEYFASVSKTDNYDKDFQAHKKNFEELNKLNFSSDSIEDYNCDINSKEVEDAIYNLKATTPGIDNIHLDMIKNLHPSAKNRLTNIFQHIWKKQVFPEIWLKSITIPILKPLKNKMKCDSYRPISITSTVSKIMETITHNRLKEKVYELNIVSKYQCECRQQHSAVDHLIRLEIEICNAFQQKEFVTAVFFVLRSAFDLTWRFKILHSLHKFGLRGNLMYFISNYLRDRETQLELGTATPTLQP